MIQEPITKPCKKAWETYQNVDKIPTMFGISDPDGVKGVYLINAVGEVTQSKRFLQWNTGAEAYLLPVLEAMMDAFPFVIQGFHRDNGSEYQCEARTELFQFINKTQQRAA